MTCWHEVPDIITPSNLEKHTEHHGLPSFNDTTRGSSYGSLMHTILAKLPTDVSWTEDMIEEVSEEEIPSSMIDDILAFASSNIYKRCKEYTIYKEYPFYVEDETMRMHGFMDMVAIGEKEIILIDFKTDRKTEDELIETYKEQLYAYKKALSMLYPDKKVEAWIYAFHLGKEIRIDTLS